MAARGLRRSAWGCLVALVLAAGSGRSSVEAPSLRYVEVESVPAPALSNRHLRRVADGSAWVVLPSSCSGPTNVDHLARQTVSYDASTQRLDVP